MEIASILYPIGLLIGLAGNSHVIYILMRFPSMKSITNVYILNLAITDWMFLFGGFFLTSKIIFKTWIFGEPLCKFYLTVDSIHQFARSILLVSLCVNRYLAIKSNLRNLFCAKTVCLFVWIVSIF